MNKPGCIVFWASDWSKQIGYEEHQEIEHEDIPKVVFEIFGKGFNVMIFHGEKYTYIAVDNKRFQQR